MYTIKSNIARKVYNTIMLVGVLKRNYKVWNTHTYKLLHQSDPAEGKEANLLLDSDSDALFLPHKKDYSRALHNT